MLLGSKTSGHFFSSRTGYDSNKKDERSWEESSVDVYHNVASALDPRVDEPTDEDSRRKICEKIENVYDRITGVDGEETRDDNDHSLLSDGEEVTSNY